MTVRVITGSKYQIADEVSRLPGEVREAIVFIDDAATGSAASPATEPTVPAAQTVDTFFAEMRPYMADLGDGIEVDDSREGVYDRREGE